jgi:MFS family permease
MVSVMALTPVHMEDHGSSLRFIGITISLHIAGMFALSPVMGWMSDRWGAARTILFGQITLIAAVAVAGTSSGSDPQITIGLILLGIGWSASMIAGSALLSSSVDASVRPLVQGFSDLALNLAGGFGGLLAGLVVAWQGFGTLTAAAGALTLPVILLVLATRRVAREVAPE